MKVLDISSETSEGGFGIAVRDGAVPGRCASYYIGIQAGNSRGAGIQRESGAGGECEYANLDTANTLSLAQDHWYSLRVEAKGARIDVYLDGQLVVSGEDSDPILAGHLSLYSRPGELRSNATFPMSILSSGCITPFALSLMARA